MLHSHLVLEEAQGLDTKLVIVDRADYEEALRTLSTPPSVALSRRNLLALLHKMEMPGSERTIIKPTPTGQVIVSAVTDEEAYRNRAPGPMHPATEAFIIELEAALSLYRLRRAQAADQLHGRSGDCKRGCCGR